MSQIKRVIRTNYSNPPTHGGALVAGVLASAELRQMWETELSQSRGPMLFGKFSIADAFFAPVCMRLRSYALPVPADVQAYVDRVVALPSVARWIQEALAEKDFLSVQEPYRSTPQ